MTTPANVEFEVEFELFDEAASASTSSSTVSTPVTIISKVYVLERGFVFLSVKVTVTGNVPDATDAPGEIVKVFVLEPNEVQAAA
jgi:hypothetical protein